ncbi:hypothetical protein KIPE111705_45705 [Kibdelosporangium persicum]|uniref:hypothetical protein n=1 Tax=Kibdelosporangium persicum TaxID=2698649 RepID=UPI001564924C|nr:hypothetical protein [Kibdelosporangium persicum]
MTVSVSWPEKWEIATAPVVRSGPGVRRIRGFRLLPGESEFQVPPAAHTTLVLVLDEAEHGIEVLIEPWAAFTLFGGSASRPTKVIDTRIRVLTRTLAAAGDWNRRFRLLNSVLARWQCAGPPCSPQLVRAWERRAGGVRVLARP